MNTNEERQNPEDENPEDKDTPLQIFALSYLYSEELTQRQKEEISDSHRMVTHHSHSTVLPTPISITVKELIIILPSSMIPEIPTVEEVCNQLNVLEERGLLTQPYRRYDGGEYAIFSITGDGMLFIKQYYAELSKAIRDKRVYEKNIVDSIEGNNNIKEYLKRVGSKVKEKSQEEMADMLLSGVKTYGPLLISTLISVITKYQHSELLRLDSIPCSRKQFSKPNRFPIYILIPFIKVLVWFT